MLDLRPPFEVTRWTFVGVITLARLCFVPGLTGGSRSTGRGGGGSIGHSAHPGATGQWLILSAIESYSPTICSGKAVKQRRARPCRGTHSPLPFSLGWPISMMFEWTIESPSSCRSINSR